MRLAAPALAAVAVLGLASGCGTTSDRKGDGDASPSVALTVDVGSCGDSWSAPGGVPVRFAVTNAFYNPTDAYLTDATTGDYLAEYEGVGTGATLEQTVTFAAGSYRLLCFPEGQTIATGPTATVTGGSETGTPAVAGVSTGDLIQPSLDYKAWIQSRLPTLLRQVRTLAAEVRDGATEKAKNDWLTAHLTYETLGAAYDAFSSGDTDFDGMINAGPSDGVDPATDDELTGFHKVEALLWTGAPASRLAPAADELVESVRQLIPAFPHLNIEPNDLPLRAHEIVENAVEFELNVRNDAGSHTELATISANLLGAQHALVPLEPLLAERFPELAETKAKIAATIKLLASFRSRKPGATEGWPALTSLTERQRAQVNGDFQSVVELLADVSAICDVRNVVPQ